MHRRAQGQRALASAASAARPGLVSTAASTAAAVGNVARTGFVHGFIFFFDFFTSAVCCRDGSVPRLFTPFRSGLPPQCLAERPRLVLPPPPLHAAPMRKNQPAPSLRRSLLRRLPAKPPTGTRSGGSFCLAGLSCVGFLCRGRLSADIKLRANCPAIIFFLRVCVCVFHFTFL